MCAHAMRDQTAAHPRRSWVLPTCSTRGLPPGWSAATMRAFHGSGLMPTSFLEIVELPDGSIVLRRAEDEEVLVTLDFSEDGKVLPEGQPVEVGKAMFSVGVELAGPIAEGELVHEGVPQVLQ